ncbi:DNA replication licensing factor mcm7-like isoform X2 [Zophobas morio]
MFLLHRRQFAAVHNQTLLPSLMRRYEVVVKAPLSQRELSVRELHGNDIGSLVKVKAMVTRVSEVKPRMTVATYICMQCNGETFQEVLSPQFMPLSTCLNQECLRANRSGAKLVMQTRGSKFVKFQEIRIQELACHVPVGHTPRTLSLHARGFSTRKTNPGDVVAITGCYLPIIESGFASLRSGLLATTYIEAFDILPDKTMDGSFKLSASAQQELTLLTREPEENYTRLSQSLAPEIFGLEDVKKALVLMLVGGVGKDDSSSQLKVRGDINICLMGDPGVAKSQLLKYLCGVVPRGIYTTGKGSSGVGLTASVQKDPLTEDLVLEGGALVLADKGVCAIDEFDKMDDTDRTSIYEVMEQQTISIAKAGITTTLNARTSILAAANPVFGRYDHQKSLTENINLPAALLSRFDLLFLLLDRPSLEDDMRLAEHVTHVHQHNRHPDIGFPLLSMEAIRAFASMAKSFTPALPPDVSDYIVDMYADMRRRSLQLDVTEIKVTPRTLLSIIRLCTALARVRLSTEVEISDVDEAIRLINAAGVSLKAEKHDRYERRKHYKDYIYAIIQSIINASPNGIISYERARRSVLNRGYSQRQFEATINAYQETSIFMVDDARTVIKCIS